MSTTVELQSVDFTNSDSDLTNSSMKLFPLDPAWVPEYFSYAAYSLNDIKHAAESNKIRIWARFFSKKPEIMTFSFVRCTGTATNVSDGISNEIAVVLKPSASSSEFGKIVPTPIIFTASGQAKKSESSGDSKIEFDFSDATFHELGVGIHEIELEWEYSIAEFGGPPSYEKQPGEWETITKSKHRIFITLDRPQMPWTAEPFEHAKMKLLEAAANPASNKKIQSYSISQDKLHHLLTNGQNLKTFAMDEGLIKTLLWTEALELACSWANGAKTIEEAGVKIADGLFNCGKFKYEADSGDEIVSPTGRGFDLNARDKVIYFHLSRVIERVNGSDTDPEGINCVDCALIVTSLTNILGGNLKIGRLQDGVPANENGFTTNPGIKLIGESENYTGGYFKYHCIAWAPSNGQHTDFGDPTNIVYDGCVQFPKEDGEIPNSVTASDIALGDENNAAGYRRRLATDNDAGIKKCIPEPSTVRIIRLL